MPRVCEGFLLRRENERWSRPHDKARVGSYPRHGKQQTANSKEDNNKGAVQSGVAKRVFRRQRPTKGSAFEKLNASVIRWQGMKPRRQGLACCMSGPL